MEVQSLKLYTFTTNNTIKATIMDNRRQENGNNKVEVMTPKNRIWGFFVISVFLMVPGILSPLILAQSSSGAPKSVEFSSHVYTYPATPFAEKQASKSGVQVELKTESSIPLTGYLFQPRDEGPHSAVVLLHTCTGITEHEFHWANMLLEWGHVVLMVDSLTPRKQTYICDGRLGSVAPWNRALDAYGAKKYLSNLSFVDPGRISVMGMSHGGMAMLEAVKKSTTDNISIAPFNAAVAYYPLCGEPTALNAPGLILIGELDTWTPAEQCVQYVEKLGQRGDMTLKVFPNGYHLFDHPGIDQKELGKVLRSDPILASQGMKITRDFLIEHLTQP